MKKQIFTFWALFTVLVSNPQADSASNESLKLSDIWMPSDVLFDPILQSQIEFLEDELFVVFNSKNNSDDFDISCGTETQNGSYFFRACEPVFLSLARQRNSSEWRAGKEALLTTESIREIFRSKLEDMDSVFFKLLLEDKKALELSERLMSLRQNIKINRN
jgi:hypothetical protein